MYQPTPKTTWSGRASEPPGERLFQIIGCADLGGQWSPRKQDQIALLGFACDQGIQRNQGRAGAFEGPAAFRAVAGNLAFPPTQSGIVDAGDVFCRQEDDLETAQELLGQCVGTIIGHELIPVVVGGGHETAWGVYQGLGAHLQGGHLGIINIDAHFDLRPLIDGKGHSGSAFLQMAESCKSRGQKFDYTCIGIQEQANGESLFKRARELGVQVALALDVFLRPDKVAETIARTLDRVDGVYLSICLDAFSAALAPGVSAPQAFGLLPHHILPVLDQIVGSRKLVAMDIVELSPAHDEGQRTAKLASSLFGYVVTRIRNF